MSPKTALELKKADIPAHVIVTTSEAFITKVTENVDDGSLGSPWIAAVFFSGYGEENETLYRSIVSEEADAIAAKYGTCVIFDLMVYPTAWEVCVEADSEERVLPLINSLKARGLDATFGEIGMRSRVDISCLEEERIHLIRLAVSDKILIQFQEERCALFTSVLRDYIIESFALVPTF